MLVYCTILVALLSILFHPSLYFTDDSTSTIFILYHLVYNRLFVKKTTYVTKKYNVHSQHDILSFLHPLLKHKLFVFTKTLPFPRPARCCTGKCHPRVVPIMMMVPAWPPILLLPKPWYFVRRLAPALIAPRSQSMPPPLRRRPPPRPGRQARFGSPGTTCW